MINLRNIIFSLKSHKTFSHRFMKEISKEKDFYEVLGVPRDASVRLIEETYQMQKKYISEEMMQLKKVQEFVNQLDSAHLVLTNKEMRDKYDIDLEISDKTANFIKNTFEGVSFVRPGIKKVDSDPRLELNPINRHISLTEAYKHIPPKVRHAPTDILEATTVLKRDKYNYGPLLISIVMTWIILMLLPDTFMYLVENWDHLEPPDMNEIV